ncbi:hypothetical protein IWZ03DRAFT_91443 [Phyllosticta citriasiana]|uniref:Secreted protein n=1 Tax=Phyllosticta citriasiana TaxID=595635 RepID=A0ABR1K805_9PEZI
MHLIFLSPLLACLLPIHPSSKRLPHQIGCHGSDNRMALRPAQTTSFHPSIHPSSFHCLPACLRQAMQCKTTLTPLT